MTIDRVDQSTSARPTTNLVRSAAAIVEMQRVLGIWKTSQTIAFIGEWASAMKANDWQPITMTQFESHSKTSRASAYRHQAIYRRVFPDQTPNDRVLAARRVWLDENTKRAKPQDLAALVAAMPI
jgi:hypothetical protein